MNIQTNRHMSAEISWLHKLHRWIEKLQANKVNFICPKAKRKKNIKKFPKECQPFLLGWSPCNRDNLMPQKNKNKSRDVNELYVQSCPTSECQHVFSSGTCPDNVTRQCICYINISGVLKKSCSGPVWLVSGASEARTFGYLCTGTNSIPEWPLRGQAVGEKCTDKWKSGLYINKLINGGATWFILSSGDMADPAHKALGFGT